MKNICLPKIGYYHGRFQPFHLGHVWVIEEALRLVDILIIGISNPFRRTAILDEDMRKDSKVVNEFNSTRTPENNPWPMWARELMIVAGLASLKKMDLSRIMFVPNLANSGMDVNEMVPHKEIVTIFIVPKEIHNKAKEQQYREDGYTVVSLNEYEFEGSGTEIRRRIREGDQSWKDLVPEGTAIVIKELTKLGIIV